MSTEIVLTAVGTVSGVAAAAVAWLEYLRRARRPREADGGDQQNATPSPDGGKKTDSTASPAPESPRNAPLVGSRSFVVLDPPVGRLGEVRGRDYLLDFLAERMSDPSGNYQVLAGLGGVGKTTVALALSKMA